MKLTVIDYRDILLYGSSIDYKKLFNTNELNSLDKISKIFILTLKHTSGLFNKNKLFAEDFNGTDLYKLMKSDAKSYEEYLNISGSSTKTDSFRKRINRQVDKFSNTIEIRVYKLLNQLDNIENSWFNELIDIYNSISNKQLQVRCSSKENLPDLKGLLSAVESARNLRAKQVYLEKDREKQLAKDNEIKEIKTKFNDLVVKYRQLEEKFKETPQYNFTKTKEKCVQLNNNLIKANNMLKEITDENKILKENLENLDNNYRKKISEITASDNAIISTLKKKLEESTGREKVYLDQKKLDDSCIKENTNKIVMLESRLNLYKRLFHIVLGLFVSALIIIFIVCSDPKQVLMLACVIVICGMLYTLCRTNTSNHKKSKNNKRKISKNRSKRK